MTCEECTDIINAIAAQPKTRVHQRPPLRDTAWSARSAVATANLMRIHRMVFIIITKGQAARGTRFP